MNSLTGKVLIEVRDDPVVSAITSRVRVLEPAPGDVPPMVIIVKAGSSRTPFGQGSGHLGLLEDVYYARCYGTTRIQAEQLAGAVSDAMHDKGPRPGRTLLLTLEDGGGGSEVEPDTKYNLEVLTLRAIGAA